MLTTDSIFSDNMVLQRDKPVSIWGGGDGDEVTVSVQGKSATIKVINGKWQVTIESLAARRNETIRITSGADLIEIQNVAVGEVWIAGGQSNMEFLLEYDAEAAQVIPLAINPDIRFFDCPKIKFEGQEKEEDFSKFGFWRPLNPANAPFYSAVGFYFASQIYKRLQVPIGIVGCNWGGTTASAWMDESYLAADESLSVYLKEYQAGIQDLDINKYIATEKRSRENMQQPMVTKVMKSTMKKTPGPLLYPLYTILFQAGAKNTTLVGPRSENRPGGLFHTMLQKIAGFSTRGVIWYQGEADDLKAELYAKLFSALIRCWRDAWKDELPFLFVQLAPYEKYLGFFAVNYPILREQQDLVSKTVPGASMASIMDAGSKLDIHPKHKRPVGERLALLARGKVYGEDILCEAPEVDNVRFDDGNLVISFLHTGTGLFLKGSQLESLELFADGQKLATNSVAVSGDTLVVNADKLDSATELEVRLAFRNYAPINLYNSADLPVKPFRRKVCINS